MIYKTWDQIRAKVQRELDLEVEEFVQPEEFVEYVNDGVSMAEAEIHKLGLEDEYFLTKFIVPLSEGVEDYSLPAPIYMNKIRAFIYKQGTTVYPITRMRGSQKFEDLELINMNNSTTDFYKYLLRNDNAADGVKLQLIPPSRETNSQAAKMWYIRECNKWNYSTDPQGALLCDLPQVALQFLFQYVKYRCYEKEGHANTMEAKADLTAIQAKMISTMEEMVVDEDSVMEADLSAYKEMS